MNYIDMTDKQYRARIDALNAAQDKEVLALCERLGFGFVMDSAARQWAERDSIGAFTVGPPKGFKS